MSAVTQADTGFLPAAFLMSLATRPHALVGPSRATSRLRCSAPGHGAAVAPLVVVPLPPPPFLPLELHAAANATPTVKCVNRPKGLCRQRTPRAARPSSPIAPR